MAQTRFEEMSAGNRASNSMCFDFWCRLPSELFAFTQSSDQQATAGDAGTRPSIQ